MKNSYNQSFESLHSEAVLPSKNFSGISAEIDKRGVSLSNLIDEQEKKELGITYTAPWLARHIVENALVQWKKFNHVKSGPSFAADLCSGAGIFLSELLDQTSAQGWDTNIYGFDINELAVQSSNEVFHTYQDRVKIRLKDTLIEGKSIEHGKKFEIIVGNPPYVSSALLSQSRKQELKGIFRLANQGTFDLSILYVEQILNLLEDNGVASIILSNKFMNSAYGAELTKIIATECNLIRIEDFNDIQVFKRVTTYTCILTFAKGKPGKRFVLRRYLGEIDHENGKLPDYIDQTMLTEQLKIHPWNFCSPAEEEIVSLCCKDGLPRLTDIFDGIQQGIRTSANDVFVVNGDIIPADERRILRQYVSGEDIKDLQIAHANLFVIYPYNTVDGKLTPFTEQELRAQFPVTYNYLLSKKTILDQRSTQANTLWFEYGRRQSLDVVEKKKILVKEMMATAMFAADLAGKYIFASGYSISTEKLTDDEITAWTVILSTPVMEFMMRHHGTQLHSGWFRLMKHHLKALRLPEFNGLQLLEISQKTKGLSAPDAIRLINSEVARAFHLSTAHVDYINSYLADIHIRSLPNRPKKEADDAFEPVKLSQFDDLHVQREDLRREVTFSPNKSLPIHNWYKYTQGFSANLVAELLKTLEATKDSVVLDPFNGCGTTVLTCAGLGIRSIGVEISPLMASVAKIKVRHWNDKNLQQALSTVYTKLETCTMEGQKLIFKEYFDKAYSKNILEKLLTISNAIKNESNDELKDFYTIGLLSIMEDVSKIRKHGSHYRFLDNPTSIGLQKLNIKVVDDDADIFSIFVKKLTQLKRDIIEAKPLTTGITTILNESSLKMSLESGSVDIVITSPPYLNRNNYIAQQKAELDLLGLVGSKKEYTLLVKSTFKSHTDSDLNFSPESEIKEVQKILSAIGLQKCNNAKIPHMICGYFSDLKASLQEIYRVLRIGGKAAFVVGNTRWNGIVVPIDHLLALIGEQEGFVAETIFVTREKGNSPQQMKKYGRIPVRESIVILCKK